jgi:hypothetical protein
MISREGVKDATDINLKFECRNKYKSSKVQNFKQARFGFPASDFGSCFRRLGAMKTMNWIDAMSLLFPVGNQYVLSLLSGR